MRLVVFTLLLISVYGYCHAQDSLKIIGRWKVIGMNNGVSYNYKKDSYFVTKSLGDKLHGRTDSAKVVADFLNWASSCSNCLYVFGSGTIYQEYRDEDVRSDGTFRIKSGQNEVEVSFIKDGTPKNATYNFKFEKGELILFVPSYFIKKDLELRLEKL